MAQRKSPLDRFRRERKATSASAPAQTSRPAEHAPAESAPASDAPDGPELGAADEYLRPVGRFTPTEEQVRTLQRYLGVPADGALGPLTLARATERSRQNPTDLPTETLWLLRQTAAFASGSPEPPPADIAQVWIFYSNSPTYADNWVDRLQAGSTIFWIHGQYPRGGAYKRRLRAGDTVLVLVGQMFIASGVLLADERLHFYDQDRRVRRPVRILARYEVPTGGDSSENLLDRKALEAATGTGVVRQGAVHPVSKVSLTWLNERLASLGQSQLPYPAEALENALAARSLAQDLAGEAQLYGILPDAATAAVIGWTREIAVPETRPAPAKRLTPYPGLEEEREPAELAEELEEDGSQSLDIDVQIPFVLDAPADSEDDLDRGPFALFLARRMHLIWCQLNGHAPESRAAPPDADTFIAHVDSPWGGGKSTFANFVARVLNPQGERLTGKHFLRSSLAPTKPEAELHTVPLDEVFVPPFALTGAPDADKWGGARRPWIIARYNAWRDQFVQPPWWQIFLALHAAITAEVKRDALADLDARRDRAGLKGLARWFGAHLSLLTYQVWNSKLKAQVGLWAIIAGLIAVLWGTGVVGNVLASATTNTEGISTIEAKKVADWITLAVALLGLGGASIATLATVLTQSFSPDLDFTSEHKHIGVRDPIKRFRAAFDRILRATDRPVLLIVDDLDRCEPRTVVEIMRGFQTIIRSPRLFVLLLGDRAWIEGAHDVHHKDLVELRGDEASLGSLYVRKVIQLSFRLPVMNDESRERFAKRVLGETDEAVAQQVAPLLVEVEEQSRQIATGTGSIGEKEALIGKLVEDTKRRLGELSSPDQAVANTLARAVAAVSDIADTQVVAAAGADTAQQREVFNAVTQLVDCLPNNPRQIKRIFMAFATYEQVGRKLFRYSLTATGEDGELRARRWRQLAMWVTLAIEWPDTWRAVARRPELLELAYGPKTGRERRDTAFLKGLPESEQGPVRTVLQRLRSDPSLVPLLCAEDPDGDLGKGGFASIAMEVDAVYEFNRIIWEPGFLLKPDLAV